MNIEQLNTAQKEAVIQTDGPIMILAGAGSGKTRTLVTRIIHILNGKNISPYHLLALTFSNKAAKEMRERISREIDYDAGALQVTTFHAFCARVLRSEAQYIGLSRNFTIYDTSESRSVMKAILSRRGISTRETSPAEVLYYIDNLKNIGFYSTRGELDSHEIDKSDPYFDFFLEYENELHTNNATDFGGLITHTIELFLKFPEVLERFQKRFKYLLVDEYQDTNHAQFELLELLSKGHRNICVVGDEDQSIYSWRGADIKNILEFEKVFPDARILKLEQNYRSSKTIIEAASHVISKNIQRKGKEMWTENDEGDAVNVIECLNDKQESKFVVKEVNKILNNGFRLDDIAVFYRNNAQSRLIEDALRERNLNYRIVGGIKFYDRKEVKDLIAYLRLITNPKDSLALSRVINMPARGIGPGTLKKLENEAIVNSCSLLEIIEKIVDDPEKYKGLRLSSRIRSSLAAFSNLIQESQLLDSKKESPSHIYEKILYESGYYETLENKKDYESQARLDNLKELETAIKQFEKSSVTNITLIDFIETISLDTSVDREEKEEDSLGEISLMTIHGAKGLEFPYVFVLGNEENIFPSFQSIEGGEEGIEEERRLFYVAMTRAMKELFLCFAQSRMLFGQVKYNGPSRFIYEIPENYLRWQRVKKSEEGYVNSPSGDFDEFNQDHGYDDFSNITYQKKSQPVAKRKFEVGKKVSHGLYGKGRVVDSTGFGDKEKVTIKFSDGIKKKFMVQYAPIELL